MRVGLGFDVHSFEEEGSQKPLILGGVTFEGEPGLKGHSDADVIAHACCEALLGAAGLGDMGYHDDDPAYKDICSITLLEEAVGKVRSTDYEIANLDCVVIAEKPRIAPRRSDIQEKLQDVIGAPVNVSGKVGEGIINVEKGIACFCVALLIPSNK